MFMGVNYHVSYPDFRVSHEEAEMRFYPLEEDIYAKICMLFGIKGVNYVVLAVKSRDVRDNFKDLCNRVFHGETLIVSRPKNENIVMMSESEYNEMMKAKKMQTIFLCSINPSSKISVATVC